MSQQQWQDPVGGMGSVRNARERAQAGLPPRAPQQPMRPRPYEVSRGPVQQSRQRPQAPAGFTGISGSRNQQGIAISRPTQAPQWPLDEQVERNQQYQPPQGRGRPQRPPRPSNVPSILDSSRVQEHTPAFQYQGVRSPDSQNSNYPDSDVMSPNNVTSPISTSSRPSTISSVGSIPDFPVPTIPQMPPIPQQRRSANLGPPPSARRGASSYYSQASFVSPIPEESPRTTTGPSHLSYASSAAMPNTYWGPDSPGYRSDGTDDYYEKDQIVEEGRESRGSNGDDSDDRGLIRSASLGKRAKPSMVTTKSFDRGDPRPVLAPKPLQAQSSKKYSTAGQSDNPFSGQRESFWPGVGDSNSPLAGGTGLIDETPSTSEESVPTLNWLKDNSSTSPSESNSNPILTAHQAASSLTPGQPSSQPPSSGAFGRLSAMRRPPRLNIDAVRDAEARGSLTSLPDLIRRATKLAAMMDRGKRPASRMNNLDDFPSDIDLSSRNKEFSPGTRNSGLSGMLAAFPPPGLATPVGERPQSQWPMADLSHEKDPSKNRKKPGRRCCGMPRWAFLLLLLGLVIVIAAAVVIPLYFLVIRKNDTARSLTPLQQCQSDPATSCQNGGVASQSTGSCSCICINGFTGSTCTIRDQGGCTTYTLRDSSVSNVTLGDSIPRLVTTAQTNFSIPLREQVVLARFNIAGLSCVGQNALVTFNGRARRIGTANALVEPSPPGATPPSVNQRRQAPTSSSPAPVATPADGIIFDPSANRTPPITTPPMTTLPGSDVFNITEEVVDFARIVVLFILQEETLDIAVAAQSNLQRFFSLSSSTNKAATNVTLGNDNVINLLDFNINLGKGAVGGRNQTSVVGRGVNKRA